MTEQHRNFKSVRCHTRFFRSRRRLALLLCYCVFAQLFVPNTNKSSGGVRPFFMGTKRSADRLLLCSWHSSCRLILHGTWSQDFSSHTPRSPVLIYVLEQRGSTTTRARRLLLLPVEPVYPPMLISSISSQHQRNTLTTSKYGGLIDSVLRNTLSWVIPVKIGTIQAIDSMSRLPT